MAFRFAKMQTENREVNQLQNNIGLAVDPVLQNKIVDGSLVQNVVLATGSNVVNHLLGRNLIGWIITRRNGVATVYDTQSTNPIPNKTLLLTASAGLTVDIYCF